MKPDMNALLAQLAQLAQLAASDTQETSASKVVEPQVKGKPLFMHPVARYVTESTAAMATGYSVKAIQRKREDGVWLEGREWIKAPDDRVLIDLEGYNRWASGTGR